MEAKERRLEHLTSIGRAMMRDLESLGIRSVAQLARRNPRRMYRELCRLKGPQDICCLDVFNAAVAQAKNPGLPIETLRQFGYVPPAFSRWCGPLQFKPRSTDDDSMEAWPRRS